MNRNIVLTAVAVLGTAAAAGRAGPLNRAYIDGEARIIAHVNMDRLKDTRMGAWFIEEGRRPVSDNKFAAMKLIFNFDPRDDLRSLTMYAMEQNAGVVVMEGRIDDERAIALARAAEGYEAIDYAGETIHSWMKESKTKSALVAAAIANAENPDGRQYSILLPGGLMILGDRLDLVRNALDVVQGRRPSLSKENRLSEELLPSDEVPFFITGVDLEGLPKRTQQSRTFDGITAGTFSIGEDGAGMRVKAMLRARDAATAQQVHSILQGIVGLSLLNQEKDPRGADVARVVQCTLNGSDIHLSLSYPVEKMVEWIESRRAPAAPAAANSDE